MVKIEADTAYVFKNQEEASWIYKILRAKGYKFDGAYNKEDYKPNLESLDFIATSETIGNKRLYNNHTSNLRSRKKTVLVKDLLNNLALEKALKIIYND